MLSWVARAKSPIGRECAMAPVWYLPQGEEKARAGPLILPVRHAGGSVVSGQPAGPDQEE
jgi:hypothetical protein